MYTNFMNEYFRKISAKVSSVVGKPIAFVMAIIFIISWALSGPVFGFSNTWQLVINTFTTITTFLIVFLIQNTQNRDSKAIHLKLDELIKSIRGARNLLLNIEDVPDEELEKLQDHYKSLHEHYEREYSKRKGKVKVKTRSVSEMSNK